MYPFRTMHRHYNSIFIILKIAKYRTPGNPGHWKLCPGNKALANTCISHHPCFGPSFIFLLCHFWLNVHFSFFDFLSMLPLAECVLFFCFFKFISKTSLFCLFYSAFLLSFMMCFLLLLHFLPSSFCFISLFQMFPFVSFFSSFQGCDKAHKNKTKCNKPYHLFSSFIFYLSCEQHL